VGEARRRAANEGSPKGPAAEAAFFKQVAQWANGNWRMPGDTRVGSDDAVNTYFYLVDTSNLWNSFGGLTEADARTLFESMATASAPVREAVADVAATATRLASEHGAKLKDEACQDAMTFAALYLAQTETYRQALAKAGGSVKGHWVLLLYRTIKGVTSIRPLYLESAQPGPLNARDIVGVVRHVVTTDLGSTTSSMGQRLRRNGGLHLAPPLASKLARP
jgi:hypothetical protein